MVMTHYMELLSLHQPWFLILFMLVPMVMAETILAADTVSLINHDERSKKWDSIAHGVTILLGVFSSLSLCISLVPMCRLLNGADLLIILPSGRISWRSFQPSFYCFKVWE